MPPKSTSTSNSGIHKLNSGESVIPASTRADGTVRKEIRVKPGYKPPEDVEVYKNRTAEAWKNRGKGGVPGAEVVEGSGGFNASANKNAKRKEARKRAAAAQENGEGQAHTNGDGAVVTNGGSTAVELAVDERSEKEKEARKLAKKLRQARELQEKREKGDELVPDQLAKVIKIHELIRQLDGLGFDSSGQPKDGSDLDGEKEKDEPS